MIVVVSSPEFIPDEAIRITRLFEMGLNVLHLRKPESSLREFRFLLKRIPSIYHEKIALHQHHTLADEFGINRWHLTESERKKNKDFRKGLIYSTSVHSWEDYLHLTDDFAYALYGPVFDSISKENYSGMNERDRLVQRGDKKTKLIAIGGIQSSNAREVFHYGFDGVALLGAIWNFDNGLDEYKRIISKCPTIVQ